MIAVVGAGAAGLMAAIHAARADREVLVFETTADGGRKILISGGGRCNVLPSVLDPARFVTGSSRRALVNILSSWPLEQQRDFFEKSLGIPLTLEPDTGKLFPIANRARVVRDALVAAARSAGAGFRFSTRIVGLERLADGWLLTSVGGESWRAASVIVTTGGLSVPQTGSDGGGLDMATRLGHALTPTYPALTRLVADPPIHSDLAGVSLGVAIRGKLGVLRREASGGFLFTHRGYSGPAALDVSDLAAQSGPESYEYRVAWGALDRAAWDERLRTETGLTVSGLVRRILPARLADRLIADSGVEGSLKLSQLPRQDRAGLAATLGDFHLGVTGHEGYRVAEVTGGGVSLGEIHPATLESRRAPGLFLAGEILDAWGPIGGHNFAWAWASGRAAGLGAAAASRGRPA